MSVKVPETCKGMRDFTNETIAKRRYMFAIFQKHFEGCGFVPLETPTMENLSTLTGKYGEEGDQLLYKVLSSGDFLKEAKENMKDGTLFEMDAKSLLPFIADKGLRYDLTVPFARFIAKNYRDLPLPYKRYQIQPVWRADKPQQGRYREFLQCDADIIGSGSDVADAEIITLYISIYNQIGLKSLQVKVNDRSVLIQKLRESSVKESQIASVIQSIDKLDKKPEQEVQTELLAKGISDNTISNIFRLLNDKTEPESIALLRNLLQAYGIPNSQILYNPTLARGLDYYTGLIFEGVIP